MAKAALQAPLEIPRSPITLSALALALRAADPAALLAPSRILRRVIKQHAGIPGLGLRVPHRKAYVIGRDDLLSIVTLSELGLHSVDELADPAILIAQPRAERLAARSAEQSLTACWRLLFHCRLHVALDQSVAAGRLTPALVERRVAEIGTAEFAEVERVLDQEDFLLPPRNLVATYVEFAALFFELHYFTDGFLGIYFPTIEHLARVEDVLREDVDAEALFHACRPAGAPERPCRSEVLQDEPDDDAAPQRHTADRRPKSEPAAQRLLGRANRARTLGNLVRSAIWQARAAAPAAHRSGAAKARARSRDDLERLAIRLQGALGFGVAETEDWARALGALADRASRGVWSAEARLLYDLQKACIDHERGVFGLNLFRWLVSWGRESIKKPLPGQRDVLVSRHLRSAVKRLSAVRLAGQVRTHLASLLASAVHRSEAELRRRFRPAVETACDSVGLNARNLPERSPRRKIIDELLDVVVERGFFMMSDVRDALSRNQLKLPDVSRLGELIGGDQLLRADKELAGVLGGVYRRGEVYLTVPQRLSSLAFGTPQGRFLTRYVAIPFGGAYLLLEFLQHMTLQVTGTKWLPLVNRYTLVVVAMFFLGLTQSVEFRSALVRLSRAVGRGIKALCIDWPRRLAQLPWVRGIIDSTWFRLARQFLIKPLGLTLAVTSLVAVAAGWEVAFDASLAVFLGVNLLLNSRFGRNVDELVTDWFVQSWYKLRIRVFSAVLRWIADVFHYVLESIERLLYAVDEYLRFRSGESRYSTAVKAVLGSVWYFVQYGVRFCVNLLIEPQINPIKHFPVVTVSHKILLPTIPMFAAFLTGPLDKELAYTVATAIVFSLPGVFGFLVWELKENWRLYEANRPPQLKPVPVGHHGETIIQLMRPGFRSGTLPKLFARLRRANRRAYWSGNWKGANKQLAALHRVEEHVRRFVDRDLVELVRDTHGWGRTQLAAGEIHLATNRILVELYSPELGEQSLWLALENCQGWLLASIHRRGWLERAELQPRRTVDHALAGFYQYSGVELVREQLDAALGRGVRTYRVAEAGLEVEPATMPGRLFLYPIAGGPPVAPAADESEATAADLPDPRALIFARSPITWKHWVVTWDLDQLGTSGRQRILDGRSVLADGGATT